VLGPSGEVKRVLCSDSLPLAILPDIDLPFGTPFTLEPEDSILLTTDGFFESRSPEGAPFGQEKMLETFRALRNYSAMEIIRQLQQTVFAFTGLSKPQDDLTAVVIKVAPSR
jgi:sigma-B regulation protein RsbU (phosphoserine phosphatase)